MERRDVQKEDPGCGYGSGTGLCCHNEDFPIGYRVYVWNLPEEKPDGSPYTSTEHNGRVTAYLSQDTYLVEMSDGESIMVKKEDMA